MSGVRLIALDLDGTLLTDDKRLTERSRAALTAAAAAGVEIVPATGRFYGGMPEAVRALPFVHYTITINGAQVWDARRNTAVCGAELPPEKAVEILRWLDTQPVIYDCYAENAAWMSRAMYDRAAEFVPEKFALQMIRELRTPVPELKAFLSARGGGVQKLQLFMTDQALRAALLRELPERFPGISATTSTPNNLEIGHARAEKGAALAALAEYLGLAREETMAFGDGLNDVSMLRAAGVGVAMGNAAPEAKAAADLVTGTNEADGVAAAIERLVLGRNNGKETE